MENNIFELFDTSDCVSNMLTHTEPEVYPEVIRTEDYSVLYNRTKNTLCGIGQNRVKRLLAAKQKEGDEIAGLYRAVLDAESSCAYYIMYMGNRRYGERYYSGYCTYIELLLKSCLQYNQLHPAKILLTHGHFDHILGVEDVARTWAIDAWIHPADHEQMVRSGEWCAQLGLAFKPYSGTLHDIADGDIISFGETDLKVIETPGHTQGGV